MCSALRKRQCSSKTARSGKFENQVQMWSPSARFGRSLMRDLRATNRLPMPPERLFKPRTINGVPKPLRNKVASESHYETEVAYKSHNVTSGIPSRRSKRFPSATESLPAITKLTWHPQASTKSKWYPKPFEACAFKKMPRKQGTHKVLRTRFSQNQGLKIDK